MTNQLSLLDTQKMVALIMNLNGLKCDHSRDKHTKCFHQTLQCSNLVLGIRVGAISKIEWINDQQLYKNAYL